MNDAATPPPGPPPGRRTAAEAWQEWTQAGRPPDAALAGAAAAVGAAAVVAAAGDGDGLADGTLVDDVLGVDAGGMTDEERDELNNTIIADGAVYAATQMQWDTFNSLDWS